MDRCGVIGAAGRLPWHLPADLRRFRRLTTGHHVVMGRRTFDSLEKPLADRTVIVLTRHPTDTPCSPSSLCSHSSSYSPCFHNRFRKTLVLQAGSFKEAMTVARRRGERELFVAGGGSVYKAALKWADRLYLTIIDATFGGDTFFPPWDRRAWISVREHHYRAGQTDPPFPFSFRFVDYKRCK